MYSMGEQFCLKESVLGIALINQRHLAVTIPSRETITVLSDPSPNDRGLVDVQWEDRILIMFAEDIERRGAKIQPQIDAPVSPISAQNRCGLPPSA